VVVAVVMKAQRVLNVKKLFHGWVVMAVLVERKRKRKRKRETKKRKVRYVKFL
jgi:hypothetical protein